MGKLKLQLCGELCGVIEVLSQGPNSHILMTGGPKDFLVLTSVLAKRDFFGSMKDAGIHG